MMRILLLLLALLPLAAEAETGKLPVVASFSVLGDLVRAIGGDEIALTTLVGPDGDAHVYQPSPGDARKLAAARLFVVNGLGLEGWMDRLIASSGFEGKLVIASGGVAVLDATDSGKKTADPHAWQDIANGRIYAGNIAAALEAADPGHAALYAQRAADYDKTLAGLDDWVRTEIGAVPEPERRIVTTHDAFRYFGRAYRVAFEAPVGMDEDSEPNAAAFAALIRQIRRDHVRALFIENMTDPRLIDQLARETGVTAGGALFADALSKQGEGGETYVAMFRHNVPAMVAAMRGN